MVRPGGKPSLLATLTGLLGTGQQHPEEQMGLEAVDVLP